MSVTTKEEILREDEWKRVRDQRALTEMLSRNPSGRVPDHILFYKPQASTPTKR